MCFSAPASFAASGGLAIIGGASFAVARKEDKWIAMIPFMFSVQQAFEGIQWLYLKAGTYSIYAGYAYLLFAYIIWPIYVPVFVYIIDKKKRRMLKYFILLGSLVSVYFAVLLTTQSLQISQLRSCISYDFNAPYNYFMNFAYMLAILCPLFFSGYKGLKWFGVATAISIVITWLFFSFSFASVWCFFAAIISSMFFFYIKYKKSI